MKTDAINLTKKLVKIPSVSGDIARSDEIIYFVEKIFSANGSFRVKKFRKNNFPSILIQPKKSQKIKIFFIGHLDVVPAPDKLFRPKIIGNKLFGRGSCDMKGSVAVMMSALIDLWKINEDFPISLLLTTDEELNGENGMEFLAEELNFAGSTVIIPDVSGGLSKMYIEHKGFLRVLVQCHGKSAHGSRPWLGKNPIASLSKELSKFMSNVENSKNKWKTTFAPTMFNAGSAYNQIPDIASLFFDIRHIASDSENKIVSLLQKNFPQSKVKIIGRGSAIFTDPTSEVAAKFKQVVEKITKRKVAITRSHSSHDGRFLQGKCAGIISMRPGGGRAHSDDEWADITELSLFKKILIEYVQERLA